MRVCVCVCVCVCLCACVCVYVCVTCGLCTTTLCVIKIVQSPMSGYVASCRVHSLYQQAQELRRAVEEGGMLLTVGGEGFVRRVVPLQL